VEPPTAVVEEKVVALRTISYDPLSDDGYDFLLARGISKETADKLNVVSGNRYFRKADKSLDSIGFIYNYNEKDYAIKWRSLYTKDFIQDGSAATLYLSNFLTDKDRLVITEGEMDALSLWEAGVEAVSIPSGAIQATARDDSARLKWMALHDELIVGAKDVYLAVDMDGPGQSTANELARRIGKAKCWQVIFPPGCKDANDVLKKHGAQELADCIANATRWPIEGIAAVSDYADKVMRLYSTGMPRGLSTGWLSVDEIYTLNPGNLVVLTGIPGHGKSTLLDALLVNAMKQHDWRVAYASFENPQEIHISKLISQKVGKPFGLGPTARMDEQEMISAMSWVNDHVTFLTNDGVMPTVESLIERFETSVRRHGVKACVVDPFNFIKLAGKDGGFDTESINDMLSQFKVFAQRAEVVFFLVAHPAKPMAGNTDFVPTGYSISGSAHFYNRADFGLTVQRKNGESILHVWKARFAHQGALGNRPLQYDPPTGGFYEQHNSIFAHSTFAETDEVDVDVPF
jgi:twinkle protein